LAVEGLAAGLVVVEVVAAAGLAVEG